MFCNCYGSTLIDRRVLLIYMLLLSLIPFAIVSRAALAEPAAKRRKLVPVLKTSVETLERNCRRKHTGQKWYTA